ncbi:hypothetical protein LCGC14_1052320 [marine sediment metagenome]|uniref:Uncharacterized protein n=1 Tax=marine sediment metagenome TaxID=412755 RepID=A0A0F9QUI6_9ZZZZ
MKKKYTEEIHVKLLLELLSETHPCSFCPKDKLDEGLHCGVNEDNRDCEIYKICKGFIGFELDGLCPCVFDREEAIKRTRIVLEEKGYLK